MADKIFPKGMSIKRHPKAPDFVVGKIGIKLEDFIPFAQQHENNGWLNIEVKKSKAGEPYLELDTWKPNQEQAPQQEQSGFEEKYSLPPTDDIPF